MISVDYERVTGIGVVLATAVLICACASTESRKPTHSTLRTIPLGSTVQVIGLQPQIEIPDARTAGETVAMGAAGTAIEGAAAGFEAGLECGPYFVICSALGMAGGAVFGAAVGGIDAGSVALPKEKAEALEQIMYSAVVDVDIPKALVERFKIEAGGLWTMTETAAPISITLGVEGLYISQRTNDRVVVQLTNSMVISYGSGALDTTKRVLFSHASAEHHVDHWIADNGTNFRAGVREAFASNMEDMIKLMVHYTF